MRLYILLLLVACYILTCGRMEAQPLPNTNIYLFDFQQPTDSTFEFSNPKYLTDFNNLGYNNQPHFTDTDVLFITVQFPEDTTQTDIYALNLLSKTKTQITATAESEYSPTLIPNGNEDAQPEFSSVRVEMDGTQRLWRFPVDRSDNGQPINEYITEIGYHYWINSRKLLLFQVGEPNRLVMANLYNDQTVNVASKTGRCFQKMPFGKVAYVHMISDKTWLLKELDPHSNESRLITATLKDSEDFITLQDGTIIMGKGSKMYKFNKQKDTTWVQIADFSEHRIYDITRLAINPDENKIAIVNRSGE